MAKITIQSEGRRHYLIGDTYSIKDTIRSLGGHWDADRRAWWTGRREVADRLVQSSEQTPAPVQDSSQDKLTPDSKIIGKALYKTRPYLLVWQGETRRGPACKLAFVDGSRVFWAPSSEVQVTKLYQEREYRGRVEHMTFGRLKRLREDFAAAKAEGNEDGIRNGRVYECQECGERVARGDGSACWETGCAH